MTEFDVYYLFVICRTFWLLVIVCKETYNVEYWYEYMVICSMCYFLSTRYVNAKKNTSSMCLIHAIEYVNVTIK